MSTFAEVFRFELGFRLRQRTTWLYFVAAAGLTWLLTGAMMIDQAKGSGTIHANAPTMIALATVVISMLMLVATAGFFGDAAARDLETGMHPLVYTSPLAKSGYLGGRFLAAFTVNALLLAVAPVGLAFVETQRGGYPELFGAWRADAYVQPYFLFALPTMFVTGAVLFAASALTGRTLAGYGAAAFLFFSAVLSEELVAEELKNGALGTLLDPFGFTALSEILEYWTPFEKNSRLVPFQGTLLWNRLTWLAIAGGALALTHLRFRFADGERRRRRGRAAVTPAVESSAPVIAPEVERTFGVATRLRQTREVIARSLCDVFATRSTLAMCAVALVFILVAGWNSAGVVLDTPTWPITYLVARDVLGDAGILIVVLTTLFAGELVWRERDGGASEITDAAPLPNWVPLLGKFGALAIALAIFMGVLMAAGMFLQWVQGYTNFEPALYAKILFGFQLADYLLWGALAMLLHVVVNQKYAAHLLFVLYWCFARFGRGYFGIEHNLLVYPAAPSWSYSDISGFEPFLVPWLAFKLYWAAWAVLFGVAATLLWVRGRDVGMRERLREARTRMTGPVMSFGAIGATAVLLCGGFVFHNTNILNDYRTRDELRDIRAEYERSYKRYEKLPQPLITRCELQVEIHPSRRAVDVRGTYRLENQSGRAIDAVHVITDDEVEARALVFDRAARPISNDERRRYRIFALDRPLQPGESMKLSFHVAHAPRGFANGGAPSRVLGNGTYFDRSWMPVIGYQPELELTDDRARSERGLTPRERLPEMDDQEALRSPSRLRDARWLHLETIIGTDGGQTAVAPGSLRRSWTANGRSYFHYATDAPIQNNYAIYSAAYAVRRDRWKDVDLEVLHHPRHTPNLDRIVRSMKATLDYHTAQFGPYPHRQLRIVEFPRHVGTYARAFPTAIAFSEGFGFLARPEDGIDYPFLVAAHEVAHQWWGNQLRPARVEGGPVLAETLAHYGAMMVLEKEHGRAPVDRFRRILLHNYLVGRQNRRSTEVPLLRSNDQKYVHYDKGAMVMYALRDAIGEERVNAALRRLLEKHRFGAPPYATTRDFLAELKAVTPAPQQSLLRDLVEEITLWELRARDPRVERTAAGAYRVTFTADAAKVRPDAVGRDRRVPMNDLVDIGVFAGEAHDGGPGEPLYLRKHRIRSGSQTISVVVPRAPTRVGVDPYHILIERELLERARGNNIVEIGGG